MSQRSGPEQKKSKAPLIIAIVLIILILVIVLVVVIVIIMVRRSAAQASKAIDCTSDADCVIGFKCNTNNGICSECFNDSECTGGKKCIGPVCTCPTPTITNATVTVTQAFPPTIQVFIDSTGGSYATNQYSITFTNSTGTFSTPEEFIPNPGNTAPTFTFDLPSGCDSLYAGYGCVANCGANHSISGKFAIKVKNECNQVSGTKRIPINNTNCDLCAATTC